MNSLYCNSLTSYSRYLTREVTIGDVPLGAHHPIRIQSMTTTNTMDTQATVEQSIRMIEAGSEYVRITAPSVIEAKNLENIKKELIKRGYKTPLIADIHFTPNAADIAARIVEKIRINPGNFVDRKKFETIDFSDADYNAELERIKKRFTPLVKTCKEYGTAMRIGTNHGSLSDRIMSRYGDTALGMVESALEFVRICRENEYHQLVLSMKSSNVQVMVQAYRLLIVKMKEEGMNYPLHLGVTEAGDGEDGRIKSALGIGTLLEDGIGDTIRVSLTEDPEFEIPVAKALVSRYVKRNTHAAIKEIEKNELYYNPFEYNRRETISVMNTGGHNVPRVIMDMSAKEKITPSTFFSLGYGYSVPLDKWNISDQACDYIFLGDNTIDFEIPGTLGLIFNSAAWKKMAGKERCYPLFIGNDFFEARETSPELNIVAVDVHTLDPEFIAKINKQKNCVLLLDTQNLHGMAEQRRCFIELLKQQCKIPVILRRNYTGLNEDSLRLSSATDLGALLVDGFGDGVWINVKDGGIPPSIINSTTFGILQAARTRISKTEYISCPSCGRTLFDLQETTAKIRSRTDHLKGVKIGIMGCIVNGPGEMADADYGYVGTGPGKITLYKGKEVVERNIEEEKAVDALIGLIKEHGDWVEKE